MKVVGFMPFWMGYHPQTGSPMNRALRKLGGRHLINYSLTLMSQCRALSDVVVFSSGTEVKDFIEIDIDYSLIKRPEYLDDNQISIEQIISEFLNFTDADVICLVHPNSPFLRPETLNTCIDKVTNGAFDSAFVAHRFQKFCWYQGQPLNYSLNEPTPSLRTVEPLILEQSSLYVFTRSIFEQEQKRVGGKTYIHPINHFEGHDVIEEEDFEIAELIVNSGMFSDLG